MPSTRGRSASSPMTGVVPPDEQQRSERPTTPEQLLREFSRPTTPTFEHEGKSPRRSTPSCKLADALVERNLSCTSLDERCSIENRLKECVSASAKSSLRSATDPGSGRPSADILSRRPSTEQLIRSLDKVGQSGRRSSDELRPSDLSSKSKSSSNSQLSKNDGTGEICFANPSENMYQRRESSESSPSAIAIAVAPADDNVAVHTLSPRSDRPSADSLSRLVSEPAPWGREPGCEEGRGSDNSEAIVAATITPRNSASRSSWPSLEPILEHTRSDFEEISLTRHSDSHSNMILSGSVHHIETGVIDNVDDESENDVQSVRSSTSSMPSLQSFRERHEFDDLTRLSVILPGGVSSSRQAVASEVESEPGAASNKEGDDDGNNDLQKDDDSSKRSSKSNPSPKKSSKEDDDDDEPTSTSVLLAGGINSSARGWYLSGEIADDEAEEEEAAAEEEKFLSAVSSAAGVSDISLHLSGSEPGYNLNREDALNKDIQSSLNDFISSICANRTSSPAAKERETPGAQKTPADSSLLAQPASSSADQKLKNRKETSLSRKSSVVSFADEPAARSILCPHSITQPRHTRTRPHLMLN